MIGEIIIYAIGAWVIGCCVVEIVSWLRRKP